MITIHAWLLWALIGCGAYGFYRLAIDLWLHVWDWLQNWAGRRVERRLKPDPVRVRKFLRHAKTGRVGLCVGSGYGKHAWLGWLRAEERIELVPCPECARGILGPMPLSLGAMMGARMAGHVEILPAREMVAALPSEIAAFKAAPNAQALRTGAGGDAP